ncbi:hypothetical protein Cylst_5389 [Cylindrospermum stagnale PCC 7417]|uniref:Uncharacterized protein n=1 Tax=Cylindrospermum stagnale PCC 7417 TaxID=56107 RepID=K9X5Q8_9NOST|nr:hypothetical protein [Cylindrospermum stagnale]AFZ27411.1 hypothetical protein Cylst_5389 [Cylindrospermum stagnale PCC 7417]
MTNPVAPKRVSMIQQVRTVISILVLTAVIFVSFNAPSYAVDSRCALIVSQPHPQSGQNNRSSGNFSAQDCPGPRLKWRVPGSIKFKVMEDKSGTDLLIHSNVDNGKVTRKHSSRSLYIANPENATADFQVDVYNTEDPLSQY